MDRQRFREVVALHDLLARFLQQAGREGILDTFGDDIDLEPSGELHQSLGNHGPGPIVVNIFDRAAVDLDANQRHLAQVSK